MNGTYTIKCYCHTYIILEYNNHYICNYDNDITYMEDIIENLEKRTKQKFNEIQIKGTIEDFDGLQFLNGGFLKGKEIFSSNYVKPKTNRKRRVTGR